MNLVPFIKLDVVEDIAGFKEGGVVTAYGDFMYSASGREAPR